VIHDDPLDLPLGCVMCNVFEHEVPIAEYILMAILMHATGVRSIENAFREGRWEGSARGAGRAHREVLGRTIGLVGYGHIGREVAIRAAAFGMTIVTVNSRSSAGDLHKLLAEADFVVIACPLTKATRGMIGAAELARMKRDAVLINIARAEIVDERALFEALREDTIGGAALDVWYDYPQRAGDNGHGSSYPFHQLENVLVTPHFSAWTGPMLERRARLMAANLDHLARGEPLDRVVLTGAWT
jgi:phosphoglycerate dehydrogenase-like enzyme